MSAGRLPRVWINVAITADGKIAPANRRFVPFGSRRDHERMMELRAQVDAVLCGARTADLGKVDLGPGGLKYQRERLRRGLEEFNLRVVVSGSGSINPTAHLFKTRFSPLLLVTTAAAPKARLKRLNTVFDDIFVCRSRVLDVPAALGWLQDRWKVRSVLCEGGGEINAPFLRSGVVSRIYVTICPFVFGGRSAPTLADGEGIDSLMQALPLGLKSRKLIGEELFCVYEVA